MLTGSGPLGAEGPLAPEAPSAPSALTSLPSSCVAGGVGVAAVGALVAIPMLGKRANKNFLPDEDESQLQLSIRAPEGTSLDAMRLLATRLARDIEALRLENVHLGAAVRRLEGEAEAV